MAGAAVALKPRWRVEGVRGRAPRREGPAARRGAALTGTEETGVSVDTVITGRGTTASRGSETGINWSGTLRDDA